MPRSLDPENSPPEECIPCLLLTSPAARFCILYLHSNAEDLGRCYSFCSTLRSQFQVHVIAAEYPGYGICPGGQATEETVTTNAFTIFGFIRQVLRWPLDEIIILGRSIGCGPALAIASRYRVYGIVLVCPFLSVCELCREFLGGMADLITERFPNKSRITRVSSPLLIVHGKSDAMVPWTHGRALYDACKSRKRFIAPEEMTHNSNLYIDPNFFVLPMLQFFGLPDYSFDELNVPQWVFDKRRCHLYQECAEVPLGMVGDSCLHYISHRDISPREKTSHPCIDRVQVVPCKTESLRHEIPQARTSVASDACGAPGQNSPAGSPDVEAGREDSDVAMMVIERYLQMQSQAEDDTDEILVPTEQLYSWPVRAAQADTDEELPPPPPDAGFLKVPRSHGGGPGFVYQPNPNGGTRYLASCKHVFSSIGGGWRHEPRSSISAPDQAATSPQRSWDESTRLIKI